MQKLRRNKGVREIERLQAGLGILRVKGAEYFQMSEHEIQNKIRIALSPYAVIFRANVGKLHTTDGRFFNTGLPVGFSDLFGFRKSDGKAVFIVVKSEKGRISPEQKNFIQAMKNHGTLAGVCRSPEEALQLIGAIKNERYHSISGQGGMVRF